MKRFLFVAALSWGIAMSTSSAEPLAVGAEAPKVAVKDQNGKEVKLEDLYKKGLTLVYFYPKADTPGCTVEAKGIRDNLAELTKLGVQVVGVSGDTCEAQKKFDDKYTLKFTLLADTEGKVIKGFGVPEMRAGIPARQSFLVKDGKVVWSDLKVDAGKHADSVKKAVADLEKSGGAKKSS